MIESTLYIDPQTVPSKDCPCCGGAVYPPQYRCSRCQGDAFLTLKEMSREYEASAQLLRRRLRQLRKQLHQTLDSEEAWHIQRRIQELTPMLTQMNDLAELTARYYEKGYYRSERYTV